MKQLPVKLLAFALMALALQGIGYGQSSFPEELKKADLPGQIEYLNGHTRIYEDYRAIREDMYRTFTRNTLDTLAKAKSRIRKLESSVGGLEANIDSLTSNLQATNEKLSESIRSKNSISLAGMQVNKIAYNTITWSLIAALVLLLAIGFISFKANRITTLKTRSDLDALKAEFEAYRQKSRLDREQMARDHFNEIKRMKESNPSSRTK
jgi:hypothetical protein